MTGFRCHHRDRGSVVLVALCFIAVLGIALASYLAVSNQAMTLSNRSHQQSVSRQLAEMGLEQTLWSFNRNDWDASVWTINGTTATRDIASPITYANGISGAIKVRVDNYDAYNRPSKWDLGINFRIGDLVSYTNGMWYRCLQAHTSSAVLAPPNLSYWAPAPIPWMWSPNTDYKKSSATDQGSAVCYGGSWYLCTTNHLSGPVFVATNWQSVSWKSSTLYTNGDVIVSGNGWYRCLVGNSGVIPPDSTYWYPLGAYFPWEYRSGVTYFFNDVVCPTASSTWYRCISSTTTNDPSSGSSADWQNAVSGSWAWSSSISYNLNEVVYSAGSFYRCVLAHTDQPPPNLKYWSPDPLRQPGWEPGHQYEVNDVVIQNGAWYLCMTTNSNFNPATTLSANYWALAPQSLAEWDATKNYGIGDTISSGGTWFRCIVTHTNQATSNPSYWTPISGAAYQWNSAAAYTPTSYVSYGGVWYHCIGANTNQTPNNPNFWKALGAPVIYAEGSATLPDSSTPLRTQLRAVVTKASLFSNAAAASATVTISGGVTLGTVDSYDGSTSVRTTQGSDSVYTYGQTGAPFSSTTGGSNVGSSAVLAAAATSTPAVSVAKTVVRGYVAAPSAASSPYAPLWNYDGTTVLASLPAGTGIDLNRVSRSPYIPQFDTLPQPDLGAAFIANNFATSIPIPAGATIDIGTPGAVSPSRYSYNTPLDVGTGAYPITTLNINGPVILYINGRLRTRPGGKIEIRNPGSAEIHCSSLRTDPTSAGFVNRTLDPKKLIVIIDSNSPASSRLENNTSPDWDFCGVIYAPKTTAPQGLEVRTGVKILGAISARRVTFSADANLHYDTSLRSATLNGVDSPAVISEWRELTDQAEKAP